MAFGAALRAANLSIAFRVKQLHFYDGNPEEVRAVVTNVEDGVLNQSLLFNKDSEHGLKKEIVLDENENDVKVAVYYGEDVVQEYLLSNISQWKQKYNRTELNFTEEPKLVLVFAAHSFNFAELKEASINITVNNSFTKETFELEVQNVTIEEKDDKEAKEKEESGEKKEEENKDTENSEEKKDEEKSEEKKDENPEEK